MLRTLTRQALAMVVAVVVVCSYVGAPVAAAATLGDATGSTLDGLDGGEQTSTTSTDTETDAETDASDDGTTDDGTTNETDDGDGTTNESDDSSGDDNSSDDRTLRDDDGGDENTSGDRTISGEDANSTDGSDGEAEPRRSSLVDTVNETGDDVENVTESLENVSAEALDIHDSVQEATDTVLSLAYLEETLGLDVLGVVGLENDDGPTEADHTYDESVESDRSEPTADDEEVTETDSPTETAAATGGSGDGDDGQPEPANPAGGAAIGLGAVATAAALRGSPVVSGSRATRSGGLFSTLLEKVRPFVLPLRYSRYDDSDPLEHDARERVYEIVNDTPGSYLSEVSQEADLPLSTTRHHIKVLEREDLVTGAKIHGKRRFYPAYAEGIELSAALNDDSTASIIRAIAEVGAASVSDLADELGRDPSTISHHLQRLEDDGIITRERDGRAVVNKLSAEARTALEPETAPQPRERGEIVAGGAD